MMCLLSYSLSPSDILLKKVLLFYCVFKTTFLVGSIFLKVSDTTVDSAVAVKGVKLFPKLVKKKCYPSHIGEIASVVLLN